MDLKEESIEEKIIDNENEVPINYKYASPEFFIRIIPKTIN